MVGMARLDTLLGEKKARVDLVPRSLMISTRPSYSSSRSLMMKELNSDSVRDCPMDPSVSARALTLL
jgi:hypothetical protein